MNFRTLFLATALSSFVLASCQQQADTTLELPPKAPTNKRAAEIAATSTAPIILPGAPGQGSTTLNAEDAVKIADNSYSPDDVSFMQNMIPHHAQAVEIIKWREWPRQSRCRSSHRQKGSNLINYFSP